MTRVHQLIWRTREWLEAHQIPIEIVEDRGHYSIKITGVFGVRIALAHGAPSAESVRLLELGQVYRPGQYFTSAEASKTLGISVTSFKRLDAWGVQQFRLEKTGAGPGTLYKIAS
ncbi:MAG: hypothetical protein ACK5P7_06210 [Bdellovibrio sp.]